MTPRDEEKYSESFQTFTKIHRGPKLEGCCAFANFGNSSGTEKVSRHEKNKCEKNSTISEYLLVRRG